MLLDSKKGVICMSKSNNLRTPLGEIVVLVDGKPYDYTAIPYTYDHSPVNEQPIDGCYRIFVPVTNCSGIICRLNPSDDEIEEGIEAGGEGFECNSFQKNNVELVIGMEDDYSAQFPRFVSERISKGVKYSNFNECNEVLFGIAWTNDYFGDDDCRCWYAADPTLSGGKPL
jgi:hypothetical protein